MADAQRSAPSRNLVARFARWTALTLMAIIGSLAITVLIEWVGLTLIWYDEGSRRSAQVLAQDLAWLSSHATEPAFGLPALPDLALGIAGRLHYWTIRWTGLEQIFQWLLQAGIMGEYILAGMNAATIFFVRLGITVTAIPLFVLFAYWGAVEGTVHRDLRRFGGDIEHGTVYHWAKHVAGAVVFIPVILYLAWPGSINPAWLFIPFACALGLNMMVVSANFTKYI